MGRKAQPQAVVLPCYPFSSKIKPGQHGVFADLAAQVKYIQEYIKITLNLHLFAVSFLFNPQIIPSKLQIIPYKPIIPLTGFSQEKKATGYEGMRYDCPGSQLIVNRLCHTNQLLYQYAVA